MKREHDYSDERLRGYCVYCGGANETIDHVPSKVFLDRPYPSNLFGVECCSECNQSYSLDEQYVACLIDVARTGTVEVGSGLRPNIESILSRNDSLRMRIFNARVEEAGIVSWQPEILRVQRIVGKLARAHIAYDMAIPLLDVTPDVSVFPLESIGVDERNQFLCPPIPEFTTEVGSRLHHRMILGSPDEVDGWMIVQPERYRYSLNADGPLEVRIVFSEYLGAIAFWDYRNQLSDWSGIGLEESDGIVEERE